VVTRSDYVNSPPSLVSVTAIVTIATPERTESWLNEQVFPELQPYHIGGSITSQLGQAFLPTGLQTYPGFAWLAYSTLTGVESLVASASDCRLANKNNRGAKIRAPFAFPS